MSGEHKGLRLRTAMWVVHKVSCPRVPSHRGALLPKGGTLRATFPFSQRRWLFLIVTKVLYTQCHVTTCRTCHLNSLFLTLDFSELTAWFLQARCLMSLNLSLIVFQPTIVHYLDTVTNAWAGLPKFWVRPIFL